MDWGILSFILTVRRILAASCAVTLVLCWISSVQAQDLSYQQPNLENLPNDGSDVVPPDILKIPQFPVPPKSTVLIGDTVLVGDDEDWSGQVFLSAPYTVIQITQYYRTEMPKVGWIETAIVRSRRTSISYTRGNRFATLRLAPQRDDAKSTDIDLVISPLHTPASSNQRTSAAVSTPGPVTLTPQQLQQQQQQRRRN